MGGKLAAGLHDRFIRLVRNPRARALLDDPRAFHVARRLLVGSQKRTQELIRRELEAGSNDSVLDVCCGTGYFAHLVPGQYLGVDLNTKFIQRARKKYADSPNKRFEVMDATRMQLEVDSYDRAMMVNAIHHFDDEMNRKILSELMRVIKKRIIIVDAIPEPENWIKRLVISSDRGDYVRPLEDQLALIGESLHVERHYTFDSGLIVQVMFVCSPRDT